MKFQLRRHTCIYSGMFENYVSKITRITLNPVQLMLKYRILPKTSKNNNSGVNNIICFIKQV
jgi:hypothetical protein